MNQKILWLTYALLLFRISSQVNENSHKHEIGMSKNVFFHFQWSSKLDDVIKSIKIVCHGIDLTLNISNLKFTLA